MGRPASGLISHRVPETNQVFCFLGVFLWVLFKPRPGPVKLKTEFPSDLPARKPVLSDCSLWGRGGTRAHVAQCRLCGEKNWKGEKEGQSVVALIN